MKNFSYLKNQFKQKSKKHFFWKKKINVGVKLSKISMFKNSKKKVFDQN